MKTCLVSVLICLLVMGLAGCTKGPAASPVADSTATSTVAGDDEAVAEVVEDEERTEFDDDGDGYDDIDVPEEGDDATEDDD